MRVHHYIFLPVRKWASYEDYLLQGSGGWLSGGSDDRSGANSYDSARPWIGSRHNDGVDAGNSWAKEDADPLPDALMPVPGRINALWTGDSTMTFESGDDRD